MSHYLIQEIESTPNLDVRMSTQVAGGSGEGRLQQLVLRGTCTGAEETVDADALFVLIGADPHTDWLPPEVRRDPHGFLFTGESLSDMPEWPFKRQPYAQETSMPRVCAAGDVRRSSVKRVASAAGEGSIAYWLVQSHFANERLEVGDHELASGPTPTHSQRRRRLPVLLGTSQDIDNIAPMVEYPTLQWAGGREGTCYREGPCGRTNRSMAHCDRGQDEAARIATVDLWSRLPREAFEHPCALGG